jgi:hypothetical protein
MKGCGELPFKCHTTLSTMRDCFYIGGCPHNSQEVSGISYLCQKQNILGSAICLEKIDSKRVYVHGVCVIKRLNSCQVKLLQFKK